MKHLGFFLREAIGNTFRNGVLTSAGTLAMTFAALVIGIFATAYWNLRTIYNDARKEVYVDVYLKENLSGSRIKAIGEHLRRLPDVTAAEYVSPEDAAKEFTGLFPEDKDILAEAGVNPLPASYRVHLEPTSVAPEAVAALTKKMSAIDGVDEAVYGQEWLAGLDRAARTVGLAGVVVTVVLGATAILVVMSTIGITVYARRDAIAVMKVVGATDGFVQMPFLFEGVFVGLISGALALALLAGGTVFLRRSGVDVEPLPWFCAVAGLAATAACGAFGSLVSVRRFLNV